MRRVGCVQLQSSGSHKRYFINETLCSEQMTPHLPFSLLLLCRSLTHSSTAVEGLWFLHILESCHLLVSEIVPVWTVICTCEYLEQYTVFPDSFGPASPAHTHTQTIRSVCVRALVSVPVRQCWFNFLMWHPRTHESLSLYECVHFHLVQ